MTRMMVLALCVAAIAAAIPVNAQRGGGRVGGGGGHAMSGGAHSSGGGAHFSGGFRARRRRHFAAVWRRVADCVVG